MIMKWLELYLGFARKTLSRKQANQIEIVITHFKAIVHDDGKTDPRQISVKWVQQYLIEIANNHGRDGALRAKGIMTTAWTWGMHNIGGFPRQSSPFKNVKLPLNNQPEDFFSFQDIKIALSNARGQSAVMLLMLLQTGASVSDVCGLSWKDISFTHQSVRFARQNAYGAINEKWHKIDNELAAALRWWRGHRPVRVPNVFMMTTDHTVQLIDPVTGQKKTVALYSGAPIILQTPDWGERHYRIKDETFASYAFNLGQRICFTTSCGGRKVRLKLSKVGGQKMGQVEKQRYQPVKAAISRK